MEVGLFLKQNHYKIMLEDVTLRAPNEACGMVAGLDGYSENIFIITNVLKSPFRFRMAPDEQLNAFNEVDRLQLELLAIYHSHPSGPIEPSPTDINEFAYPGVIYLIWSQNDQDWVCHGYRIANKKVVEVPIIIIEDE
jgi:[CysO sulfur-carrier protein]-S-L-cysteine hydrolase